MSICAFNYTGESEKTAAVKVTTKKIIDTPATPTGLAVTSQTTSPAAINLSWTEVTGSTGYNIYRATKMDYAYC